MARFPSVFISHGPPTIAIEPGPVPDFLHGLGPELGRPEAILCVSAHWETPLPAVGTAEAPELIYDFYGFPEPLYELTYPAPGAPALAEKAAAALGAAGIHCDRDPGQGLDHGAWVPLMLMYPDADVPVAQLSIQHHLGPAHHLDIGKALSGLRDEGVLVLGSGNVTHNLADALGRWRAGEPTDLEPLDWAVAFDEWVAEKVEAGKWDDLVSYRTQAPFAEQANPRDEHLLPLYVAAGAAGGDGVRGRRIHKSFMWASLSMAAFAFDGRA
ncbi:MAG: DODA-type extradiol aromatic ring-opening family dioxygenase [Alphaproteobacteria bacterium]